MKTYKIEITSSRSLDGTSATYSVEMAGFELHKEGTWERDPSADVRCSNSVDYSEFRGSLENHDELVRSRLAGAMADAIMGVTSRNEKTDRMSLLEFTTWMAECYASSQDVGLNSLEVAKRDLIMGRAEAERLRRKLKEEEGKNAELLFREVDLRDRNTYLRSLINKHITQKESSK